MRRIRPWLVILGIIVVIVGLGFAFRNQLERWLFRPTDTSVEQGLAGDRDDTRERIQVVAEGLNIPWEAAFLPDGDILVTERPGTLRRIGQNEQLMPVDGVRHIGEGGLLGLSLHPDFARNNWLYVYFTTNQDGQLSNKIVRYTLGGDGLSDRTDILTGIPAASNHNGGRIAFGPDGYLYVGTGDAGNSDLAQDTSLLAGKILRLRSDGSPAPGNPFNNEIYSYGHRNVQGLAWDNQDRLWATEHGPSGTETGHDELNLIKAGANYGWPHIRGDQTRSGMEVPIRHSGADETWAPAGLAYSEDSLFFAGLRGQTLYEAVVSGDNVKLKAHFRNDYGRLRAVVWHDGDLYITTSNTDGRGNPRSGDDKLIRLSTSLFN